MFTIVKTFHLVLLSLVVSYSAIYSVSIIVANISKREFLSVINLLRQLFHVFAQFLLGNFGIYLGCLYVLVTKH